MYTNSLFSKYRGRLTVKRNKGAQPGNRNARKHGFYSKVMTRSEKLELQKAVSVEGLGDEIALLRLNPSLPLMEPERKPNSFGRG